MTIILPEPSLLDRLLSSIGKKRGVFIPTGNYEKFGPYACSFAQKESFWKALLRPGSAPLPDGFVEIKAMAGMKDNLK